MSPAQVIRVTPAEACRYGVRAGHRAAEEGADPDAVTRAVLGRLFWRIQTPEVRRCLAVGVGCGYAAAIGTTRTSP